jgi:hypothetical protein
MAFGAQARIGEDLGDGVARRRALLDGVGAAHRTDEIRHVIVGNVLQGVGHARNDVIFADHRHGFTSRAVEDFAASKTNCAANLPSRGLTRIANRYTRSLSEYRKTQCGLCEPLA